MSPGSLDRRLPKVGVVRQQYGIRLDARQDVLRVHVILYEREHTIGKQSPIHHQFQPLRSRMAANPSAASVVSPS